MQQGKLQDGQVGVSNGKVFIPISAAGKQHKCHNIQGVCSSVNQVWEDDQPLKHQLVLG